MSLRLPSPATALAALALLVAGTGTGYAAATIGTAQLKNNAVTSPKIKNGQVKSKDLAANSVTSKKVKNGSLQAADFAAGQLTSARYAILGSIQSPAGDSFFTVRSIANLAQGSWIVSADFSVVNSDPATQNVDCYLSIGPRIDGAFLTIPSLGRAAASLTVATTTLDSITDAVLSCNNPGAGQGDTVVSSPNIEAFRVQTLIAEP